MPLLPLPWDTDGAQGILATAAFRVLEYELPRRVTPQMRTLFPTRESVDEALLMPSFAIDDAAILYLDRNVVPPLDVLYATTPAYSVTSKLWAVYVIILENGDGEPRAYTGSATSMVGGVRKRLGDYKRMDIITGGIRELLPKGYEMAHMGLLATAEIPCEVDKHSTRGLFLLLETMFMYGFWTIRSTRDYGIPLLQPLNTHQLEYQGVNSRPATMEFGADTGVEVTPEAAAITAMMLALNTSFCALLASTIFM
ncbi:hypothetical protein DL768_000770 [Monosporascus sp. mg162]|nr:hypothetical protein DL768_000770 [Monosporascus sp. mg162]